MCVESREKGEDSKLMYKKIEGFVRLENNIEKVVRPLRK